MKFDPFSCRAVLLQQCSPAKFSEVVQKYSDCLQLLPFPFARPARGCQLGNAGRSDPELTAANVDEEKRTTAFMPDSCCAAKSVTPMIAPLQLNMACSDGLSLAVLLSGTPSSSWDGPEEPHSLEALAIADTDWPLPYSHRGDSGEIIMPAHNGVSSTAVLWECP